jgi:hypothetical protein
MRSSCASILPWRYHGAGSTDDAANFRCVVR